MLNGKRYKKGLGGHARSSVVFHLDRKFSWFESDVGLDDTENNTPGSIVFTVFVDGEPAYRTPVMKWDSETLHIRLNISGAEDLCLVVDDAGDGDTCDHGSWAGAVIY
jgi:hypothetical protein